MSLLILLMVFLCGSYAAFPPEYDHGVDLPTNRPLTIAHRGSSGMLPEHTAAAYQLAIDQGADVIECDVCITMDLRLVCAHDSFLDRTTDVAEKFPDRLNTYFVVDIASTITDYFTVDLTLEELKTLRVRQRFGSRDPSKNGDYPMASLEEYIEIAQKATRPIGIYPETKAPQWVNSLDILQNANTTFEKLLIDVLESYGYTEPTDPCFVQSFSMSSLYRLRDLTNLPLIRLTPIPVTDGHLDEIAEMCYGLGPSKSLIVTVSPISNYIVGTTDLVDRAHARGLRVHPYTFRNEDSSFAYNYGLDPHEEYRTFLETGVDGFFTDFPATLTRYLNATYVN